MQEEIMDKEAAPNPQAMWKAVKKLNPFRTAQGVNSMARKPKSPIGTFVNEDVASSAVKSGNARFFNEPELRNVGKNPKTTGGLTTDAFLGLTKKVAPKTREPIEKAVETGQSALERMDTRAGAALAGSNPSTMRGKFFSTKTQRQVGEVANEGANSSPLFREDRRPSLLAPVTNTSKVVTPFLGAAYVGDKLYGPMGGQTATQPPYQPEEQLAYDERQVYELEKVAFIQKVADLEREVEIVKEDLHQMAMEKKAKEEAYEHLRDEYEQLEKTASGYRNEMMSTKATHEELRLRTLAQQRSKTAVDLADQLLETGLIKQAQYDSKVDELMVCDDNILNSYELLVKQAQVDNDSVESLPSFMEYKGNDNIALSPHLLKRAGLNWRGQTMGEAARDLIK